MLFAFSTIFSKEKEEENMVFEEKEKLMVAPNMGVPIPKLRKAHFLQPLLDPKEPLPEKPHSSHLPLSSNGVKPSLHFKGRTKLHEGWEDWLENLKPTHQQIWKKAGIFDAIRGSTYYIRKHNELILWLAQKWCPETNTFIFPWGETTISLEDMLVLGGFSVLGSCVRNLCLDPESEKLMKKLVESSSKFMKLYTNLQPTHNQWLNHYKGRGGELENAAFIAFWLSRYIFSTGYYGFISPHVFPIAVSLARGVKIALGPLVLASIYRDISLLKNKMVITNGGSSHLTLWSPLQYFQLWAWERFPTLSPRPTPLAFGEPRLARWHDLFKQQRKLKSPRFDIKCNGYDFVWRPYTRELENWVFPKFYPDVETCVLINSDVDEGFLSWASCISGCVLVGMDCAEPYLPHRIALQFGMDQDIPSFLSPRSSDREIDGLKLYVPHRLFKGQVTMEYSCWLRNVPFLCDETWTVYVRRKRSNKEAKIMDNFEKIAIEGEKGKKLKERHDNIDPKGNSKFQPSFNIISSNICENIAEDDTQQFQEEVKGSDPKENQKEIECVKEPPKKSEMDEDHEDGGRNNAEKKGLNQVNNRLDNVVIIDENEDDSDNSERNPLEAIAFQLEARINKTELLISRIRASRQGR